MSTYERLESCPSCKNAQSSNYKIIKDHTVSNESFAIVKCENCSLLFTNPRPDKNTIGYYYQDKNYISHTNKITNPIHLIYRLARYFTIRYKMHLITKHIPTGKLLDYGCGTGHFIHYAHSRGFQIDGIEPDKGARVKASAKSVNIFPTIDDLPLKPTYDVITAWHVLEHVHDIKETFDKLLQLVKPKGFLYIALPNIKSFDAVHYDTDWAAWDIPKHLYHFSPATFKYFIHSHKLKIHSTYPLYLDSYYISLLSERNKDSKSSLINAIKIGYLSNKKAKKSNDYSSLIYVIKK
ncbi:MAG: class I SAM-dependent methyltransferase [Cyclobacteriaceae bacterium]|nr:class I SAM-dependent methyltransferase [Cyclobacteriaceae bacterium]